MENVSAFQYLQSILGILINLIGLAYIAVRVEHRLTKMETHIEHLRVVADVVYEMKGHNYG